MRYAVKSTIMYGCTIRDKFIVGEYVTRFPFKREDGSRELLTRWWEQLGRAYNRVSKRNK